MIKYRVCLSISGASFCVIVETYTKDDDIEYIAEHIASSLNASLLYSEQIEE